MVYPEDKKVWMLYLEADDGTMNIEEIYGIHFTRDGAYNEKVKHRIGSPGDEVGPYIEHYNNRLKVEPFIVENP